MKKKFNSGKAENLELVMWIVLACAFIFGIIMIGVNLFKAIIELKK